MRKQLEEIDPEAAKELAQKEELRLAEERLRLRHGGHKKWARDMRRFKGKMEDKETREQYHEMIREKNSLKDRQRRTRLAAAGKDEVDYDSESDDSEEMTEEQLKKKAINKIREQVEGQDGEEEGEDSDGSSDDGDELEINFNEGAKKRRKTEE